MARTVYAMIMLLVLLAGTILLQIFLSGRESKWPGLVLPCITFLYSVLMVLNIAAVGGTQGAVFSITAAMIFGNLPTLVLLAIYAACREKRKKKSEIHRMQISDL